MNWNFPLGRSFRDKLITSDEGNGEYFDYAFYGEGDDGYDEESGLSSTSPFASWCFNETSFFL